MFHVTSDSKNNMEENVDGFGDSYARDVTVPELKNVSELCSLGGSLLKRVKDIRARALKSQPSIRRFEIEGGARSA